MLRQAKSNLVLKTKESKRIRENIEGYRPIYIATGCLVYNDEGTQNKKSKQHSQKQTRQIDETL